MCVREYVTNTSHTENLFLNSKKKLKKNSELISKKSNNNKWLS